ncbi:hypothetical protein [Metabacillus litoralis]|uniref:Uncharacterized protein n=1 Tax=Metabacillus litoralis TaxID=152268 RepID=A0A179SKM2_9BACI|nr:hypothetical protein [Metabacillus litoralis]OAS82186.1 hypothetical protein A6K24_14140 [Metabacillus litoralis]
MLHARFGEIDWNQSKLRQCITKKIKKGVSADKMFHSALYQNTGGTLSKFLTESCIPHTNPSFEFSY